MKMIRNWIILVIAILTFSGYLFVSGRQHSVFLENGTKKKAGIEKMKYSLDGEKLKTIKSKKKKLEFVKGQNHELLLEYTDKNGKKIKFKKEFKLGVVENVVISLPKLVDNKEDAIVEFKEN